MWKKVQLKRPGPPGVLEVCQEEGDPRIMGNEVLIDLKAAGVTGWDARIRSGDWPVDLSGGWVPGAEGAGIVTAVGPDVRGVQPGERVAVLELEAFRKPGQGTYAGKIVLAEDKVLRLPSQVDFVRGAALPLAWISAFDALIRFAPLPETGTVLVASGAGAVGLAAMQVARLKGLKVIGVTRSADKLEALAALGVRALAASDTTGLNQQIRTRRGNRGIDYVFDGTGLGAELADVINPGGSWVHYGIQPLNVPPAASELAGHPVTRHVYEVLQELAEPGRIQAVWKDLLPILEEQGTPVAATFPLEQAAEAHRCLERQAHVGRIVLTI